MIIRNKFIDTQVKKKYILNYLNLYIFITNLKMNEVQKKNNDKRINACKETLQADLRNNYIYNETH